MDSQINALSERVARLEKANRVMKMIVAVTVLAVGAMTSTPQLLAKTAKKMASLDAGVITAQRINLVNAADQTVAVLGTDGNSAGLVFVDNSGKWLLALGASLGASNSSAGLVLYDGNSVLPGASKVQQQRVGVGISSQGAGLTAMNGAGQTVLVSGVTADSSSAGSQALDSSGFARAGFGIASNGSGFFANDSNNVTRYVAGVAPDGTEAGTATYDATGVTRYVAGVALSGAQAGTVTYDATGKPQLELGGAGDGSANGMIALDSTGQDRLDAGYSSTYGGGLEVKDSSGSVIWSAP